MTQNTLPGPSAQVLRVRRLSKDIFGDEGKLYEVLRKAAKATREAESNQGSQFGRRLHLIAKDRARDMRDFNVHHSACIDAKVTSSVGLGHREQKIHDVLDPLCQFSWQDTLNAVAEDLIEGADGFIEVVRGDRSNQELITGLFHVSGPNTFVEVEEQDNNTNYHYSVIGETTRGNDVVMARFGDLARLKERFGVGQGRRGRPSKMQRERAQRRRAHTLSGSIMDSEIIHFRRPTARSRWYGFPDWLAGTPSIELVQCMTQHEFDFYFNRGVPEFLLFLIGQQLPSNCWEEVKNVLGSGQGLGNSHKSGAFHFPVSPEEMEVVLHKLALENTEDGAFSAKSDTLASQIVSVHGVPPILAGLQIPGKMGGNNEGPNSLLLFQRRKLSAIQKLVSSTLACTIGLKGQTLNQPEASPARLTRDAFLGVNHQDPIDDHGRPMHPERGNGFNSILDGMSLGAMDTMSRMREPITGSSRDLKDGILSSQDDRNPQDPKSRSVTGQRRPAPRPASAGSSQES